MTEPVKDPAEDYTVEVAEDPHHDEEDIATQLGWEIDDAKGGSKIPPEDFVAYADPEAEKENDS